MKAVPDQPETWRWLKPELRASWKRSSKFIEDPGNTVAPVQLSDAELQAYRQAHPLNLVRPVLQRLLVQPAADTGLLVAIGDSSGRLLWVDGDHQALRRAENSAFQAGAVWSEQAIGTSAPGMAVVTRRGVQVHQEEHFASSAHQFSCSAAPIRDPQTGRVLGVVDLTGDEKAVATHSLALIYAAVCAAESELKALPPQAGAHFLSSLGTPHPHVTVGSESESLSLRHAEILTLLAWYAEMENRGLSAQELSELLFGELGHEVAIRAEMVRLRRTLTTTPALQGLSLGSKPYTLSPPLELDALELLRAITNGDRDTALRLYTGPLLPGSESPGILNLQRQLSAVLREALINDGSSHELWRYLQLAEAAEDVDAIYTALRLLPPESPQRSALVARMQR